MYTNLDAVVHCSDKIDTVRAIKLCSVADALSYFLFIKALTKKCIRVLLACQSSRAQANYVFIAVYYFEHLLLSEKFCLIVLSDMFGSTSKSHTSKVPNYRRTNEFFNRITTCWTASTMNFAL